MQSSVFFGKKEKEKYYLVINVVPPLLFVYEALGCDKW